MPQNRLLWGRGSEVEASGTYPTKVPPGFTVKIANFSQLHCLAIPRRDLNTKKTKPNIEK